MRPIFALLVAAALPGCVHTQGARYVYQDRDFGVVGMPENTDCWPTHYRRHAEKLMEDHFPEGHEIVRAEEVIEGVRTLKVEGSSSAEVAPQLSSSVKVVKLGHSASRSEAETVKVKECRIIYRRAGLEKTKNTAGIRAADADLVRRPECRRAAEGGGTAAGRPEATSGASVRRGNVQARKNRLSPWQFRASVSRIGSTGSPSRSGPGAA